MFPSQSCFAYIVFNRVMIRAFLLEPGWRAQHPSPHYYSPKTLAEPTLNITMVRTVTVVTDLSIVPSDCLCDKP